MRIKKGTFIVMDGGEGSGKDMHIERIKKLCGNTRDVLFTREPGGTEIGLKIRKILLSEKNTAITPETELMLFCAARAQLMREVVIPALKAGRTVVSNRFDAATAAYQIYGRERRHLLDIFQTLNTLALTDAETGEVFRPDRYILLDVSPRVGLLRKSKTEEITRFEKESLAFHERVREGFKIFLAMEHVGRHDVINADRNADEVWRDVENTVAMLLV